MLYIFTYGFVLHFLGKMMVARGRCGGRKGGGGVKLLNIMIVIPTISAVTIHD